MYKLIFVFALAISLSLNANAQTPDSTLKPSPVKTLSNVQYNALLHGDDINDYELAAALNGYPSADKALKFKKELGLSPAQAATLNKISVELKRKKIEMGNFIITNETRLNELFQTHKINESNLIYYTNRYGLYQGELRNAILNAALKTYDLLSPGQLAKLNRLK